MKVKIIEKDPNKEYVIVRINNEEVKIEKPSNEELDKLKEIIKHKKSKYEILIKEIKKIEIDPELADEYISNARERMEYYFGQWSHFIEKEYTPHYGCFFKYKRNYFFVYDDWKSIIFFRWFLFIPKEIYEKNETKYEPPKDVCEEFIAVIENIMFPKYEIEFIDCDRVKGYLELKINGEEVKIEKVDKEELEKFKGLSRIDKWPLLGGTIRFKREELRIKKPLAIYRLMLYFGIPTCTYHEEYCCEYLLKYKGHYFTIEDEIFECIRIKNTLFVADEIGKKYYQGTGKESSKIREEYGAPEDICEEFIAIIKYLINNPAMVYIDTVGEYAQF